VVIVATQYVIRTGTTALVAATAKVVIELPTGSTQGLTVIGLEVFFSAASAGSCQVEWGTFTTTGTGTTLTAQKYGVDQGVVAVLGTVKINNTANPAGFAAAGLPSWVMPLPGSYSMLLPQWREMFQPASVNRCLRLTSTLGTDTRVNLYIEQ
jgi:hypothetical protein